jgi:GH24 family phage-related lysozyme (muramidase)
MKLGDAGKNLIKSFEGCRLTAYKVVPTEKYWTIGYGHYGPDVKQGMTITQAQADELFEKDIQKYVKYVNDLGLKLNQNQFDALVSFCYNCGPGNLTKLCNGKSLAQIAKDMLLYNKSGGKVLNGLIRRRQAEYNLFIKPVEEGLTVGQYEELVNQINQLKSLLSKKVDKPDNYHLENPQFGQAEWNEVTLEGYFDGTRPHNYMSRVEGGIVTKRITDNVRKVLIDPLVERIEKLEEKIDENPKNIESLKKEKARA